MTAKFWAPRDVGARKGWLLWSLAARVYQFFESRVTAEDEAERLRRQNPRARFVVLRTTRHVGRHDVVKEDGA